MVMFEPSLSLVVAGALQAQQPASPPAPPAPIEAVEAAHDRESAPKKTSRWFVRVGALGAFYNAGARIALDGKVIPGGTARVTDSKTLIFDIGYDLSDDWSLMVMGGIPPTAKVIGQGGVASFGELGKVRFGPAIVTAVYRLPEWHGFRPYVGAGVAHLFILKEYDRAVTQLKVHDDTGFVVQAGVEYRLSRKWELFADYKHVGLHVHADGYLAGEPVRARVTLNPDLVSTGIKFHFR